MENEKKFPTYGIKQKFLEGIALNRGKNLLITSEVRKRDTGEFIKEEQRIVYEKYVDGDVILSSRENSSWIEYCSSPS